MQGKPNARFGVRTKKWTKETTLHSTFGPKTMIVGNVTAPLRQLGYSFQVSLTPKKKEREK